MELKTEQEAKAFVTYNDMMYFESLKSEFDKLRPPRHPVGEAIGFLILIAVYLFVIPEFVPEIDPAMYSVFIFFAMYGYFQSDSNRQTHKRIDILQKMVDIKLDKACIKPNEPS